MNTKTKRILAALLLVNGSPLYGRFLGLSLTASAALATALFLLSSIFLLCWAMLLASDAQQDSTGDNQ